ncbi:MAG: hypothetical protein GY922_10915 [Proteobacteria bacterium]|nr:hypothetical protein [Pseudomonadota bacterium]
MNHLEAFDLALRLAITAPSEEKLAAATQLAEEFAMSLTAEEIKSVQRKYEEMDTIF